MKAKAYSICSLVSLTLLLSFPHIAIAQPPSWTEISRSDDGSVTISYAPAEGFYHTLWRTNELGHSFIPISFLSPDTNTLRDTPSQQLRQTFYRLSISRNALPADADGDGIDDLFERAHQPLDPFNGKDASSLTPFGITHLENYHRAITEDPPYTQPAISLPSQQANRAPTTRDNLDYLIDIEVVNDAASDYTPTSNGFQFLPDLSPAAPATPGFQFRGDYFIGASDTYYDKDGNTYAQSVTFNDGSSFSGEVFYYMECARPYPMFLARAEMRDTEFIILTAPLYAREGRFSVDFDPAEAGTERAFWDTVFPNTPISLDTVCEFVDMAGSPIRFSGQRFTIEPASIDIKKSFLPGYSNFSQVSATHDGQSLGFFCNQLTMNLPWLTQDPRPSFTGDSSDCTRVYLATYDNQESVSQVVEFPLVDGTPTLVMKPKEPGILFSQTRLLTSRTDPRRDLSTPSSPNFLGELLGDVDEALISQDLLPLQDLHQLNANDFGDLFIPKSGMIAIDSSLLTDSLTASSPDLVGLPLEGAQVGTLQLKAQNGQQTLITGFGASITRDGTFPWVRSKLGTQPDAMAVNSPTGLRCEETISTTGAQLTAHSIELVNSGPTNTEYFGISLSDCDLRATGGSVTDPLTKNTWEKDPRGNYLGYIHLISPENIIQLYQTTLSAATDITIDAPVPLALRTVRVLGGSITANSGAFSVRSGKVDLLDDCQISAPHVWIDGAEWPANEFSTFLRTGRSGERAGARFLGNLNAASTLKFDNFQSINLTRSLFRANKVRIRATSQMLASQSLLEAVTIESATFARVYANHTLTIRERVKVQHGQIAAPVITVDPGATLELTGPDAHVFANTHNYGHGEFGTLSINGITQSGEGRPPSFHRRPFFEDE